MSKKKKSLIVKFLDWLDKVFERKDEKRDYCSCSPDILFGVDIGKACKIHDEDYITGRVSRKEADKRLRNNMIKIGTKANKRKRITAMAWIYWGAVRLFGTIER